MVVLVHPNAQRFVQGLEKRTKAKVARHVDLLETYNYKLKEPFTKKLVSNLFELRIRGEQEIRLFYTFKHETVYIVSGFIKKTQKTPKKEIEKSIRLIKTLDI